MKKTIMTFALIAGFNAAVLAQDVTATPGTAQATKKNLTPEERAKKGANHAEKKLGLTAQ